MSDIAGAILIVGLAGVSAYAYSKGLSGGWWALLAVLTWLLWNWKF